MKKIFSLFVALTAVFSLSAKTLYLQPNEDWKKDGARFAICVLSDPQVWVDMKAVEGEEGIYSAEVETKSQIIFCRMKGDAAENNWNNKWNQTADLDIPEDKDLCIITGWDNASTWAKFGEIIIEPEEPDFYIAGSMTKWAEEKIAVEGASYKLNLEAGNHQLKVIVGEVWKGFSSLTYVADGLSKDENDNICFELKEAGEVNVHYDAEAFFLNGKFYVAPEKPKTYYLKNNWKGAQDWSWIKLALDEDPGDEGETHISELVVFGGVGVNISTDPENDADPLFIPADKIKAISLSEEGEQKLEALDTVVFFYQPEQVNAFTGANGLTAQIIGKYVEPAPEPVLTFSIAGSMTEWAEKKIDVFDADSYVLKNLAAGEHKVKIIVGEVWKGFHSLTTVAEGLSADENDNICFELKEAGDVTIHFDGEYFFLNGKFYVAPAPQKNYWLKNNWKGAEEWSWIALKLDEDPGDEGETHISELVVFGGNGVNISSDPENDSDPRFIPADKIKAISLSAEGEQKLEALDTVVFFYQPEQVNAFTGASGLTAQIIGKYVAPAPEPEVKFSIAGSMTKWAEEKIDVIDADSYVLKDLAAGEHKVKIIVGEEWKGFHALTTVAEGLSADEDDNICFELKEAGDVTIHFDGEYFFLRGNFYVAPVQPKTYFLKNNWKGAEEWSWIKLALDEDPGAEGETHMSELVVFGGGGVNISTDPENDSDPLFIPADKIELINLSSAAGEVQKLEALDTVVFFYQPEQVNAFTGASGLYAQLIGKYVEPAPEPTPDYYIAGSMTKWAEEKIAVQGASYKLNLEAGNHQLKVIVGEVWKGFHALTTVAEGLSADENDNICFKLEEAGEVTVHYDGEYFFLRGNFYVAPEVPKTYFLKNNWGGVQDWTWKEMKLDEDPEETRETHILEGVVFGGGGVNISTDPENDADPRFIAAANIEAFDLKTGEKVELGALDTVVFYYHPQEFNRYNPEVENGLAALIIGKYVEPQPEDPTVAVIGSMTNWEQEILFELAEDKLSASLVANIDADSYEFKIKVNGEFRSNAGRFDREHNAKAGISENAEGNMTFVADVTGDYKFEWFFANDSLAITYPEKPIIPEPVLEDGFYLIGKIGGVEGWDVEGIDADNLLVKNLAVPEEEYSLNVTLLAGDEFKVVRVESDVITLWFPQGGEDKNFKVDKDELVGEMTVYFRPHYDGGDDWWEKCIYVTPSNPQGLDNTAVDAKAEKMLENGILIIRRGGKTFNGQGQLIK